MNRAAAGPFGASLPSAALRYPQLPGEVRLDDRLLARDHRIVAETPEPLIECGDVLVDDGFWRLVGRKLFNRDLQHEILVPENAMKIQPATSEHVDGVVDLENILFDNSFGPGIIRQEISIGYGVVVTDRDVVVAYAIVRPCARLNDLLRLGVRPDHQNKGIGSALLEHVLERFKGEMLLTVRKNNKPAIRLYQKAGFEIVGVTEMAWLMRRARPFSAP